MKMTRTSPTIAQDASEAVGHAKTPGDASQRKGAAVTTTCGHFSADEVEGFNCDPLAGIGRGFLAALVIVGAMAAFAVAASFLVAG